MTDLKIFLKAPSAPIYTNFEVFEGRARAEKSKSIGQNFPKNAFFGLFFKILPAAQKI